MVMNEIFSFELKPDQAVLWFLGQAGYVLRSEDKTIVIDPYLSDSVGKINPSFSRAVPVPLDPSQLKADIFIVTHDHTDHLDPETIEAYKYKDETLFIAPRLACKKLISLGVSEKKIYKIDSGEASSVAGTTITGVYAVPTGPDVPDTTGYLIEFENGRSVYHTSDTAFSDLLLKCVPHAEVLLVCINGKWSNLNAEQAAKVTAVAKPRFAVPNHYDVMALNSENPETFEYFAKQEYKNVDVHILNILEPFVWS